MYQSAGGVEAVAILGSRMKREGMKYLFDLKIYRMFKKVYPKSISENFMPGFAAHMTYVTSSVKEKFNY
jgi:hypothetical protein